MDPSCRAVRSDTSSDKPNPSDAFYGPWFSADFDLGAGTVNGGFGAHPYDPATTATGLSNGNVTGARND